MPWKNELQLSEEYTDPDFRKAFAELFTLSYFFSNCFVPSGYKPPDVFGEAISITSTGKEWVRHIKARVRDISLPEINFALFLVFFHHGLFIDVTNTEPETILRALDAEILGGRIRYPWVYGRVLYDRFFDMFLTQTEELLYEETTKLLENTPQGVFQIRDVVVGPFGVLNSSCQRFLEPVLTVPLWHCSDPSCSAFHKVGLSSGKSRFSEAEAFISEESEKVDGPPSEWFKFFLDFAGKRDHYDDMSLAGLPWLLASDFSETEMQVILGNLVEQYSKEIRKRFPKNKRFKDILSGPGVKISGKLTKEQCFQLILLMPDEIITSTMEFLIDKGAINIPITERRRPRVSRVGGWLGVVCECSRFGIRSVARANSVPFSRLKRLIKNLYKEESGLRQLEWKLRHVDGKNVYEKLDRYLHTTDPKNIIGGLVLDTQDHLQRAFKNLRYGWFILFSSDEEEEHLVKKILWKLGFDVGLYPSYSRLFWERLEKFLKPVRIDTPYDEHSKELIRSAGVNFFVSLEEILDYSLSFTTWALLSDHYGITKFKCNFEQARRVMASYLNGRKLGSNEPLEFDPNGKNTLYPLIQGFAVLAELCSETIESKSDQLKRLPNEFPGYHGKTEIEIFPFFHKLLILDLREGEREQIIELLKVITETLEKYEICNIRNRIEHKRADFPTQEEIQEACKAVADTVNRMEETGICPLIYLYVERTIDQYGRGIVIFKDYKGREIKVRQPTQYGLCKLPSIHVPQVVAPCMHIGDSFDLLRFQFEENSDYVEIWGNYPKRRARITDEELQKSFTSEQE